MSELRIRDLCVELGGRPVVAGLSTFVEAGSWVSVIGPNGAGKSTLLRSVAGLLPYAGSIKLGEREVSALDRRSTARCVALVPQSPLIPAEMTVREYVLLGRTPHVGYLGSESSADRAAAERALACLDLLAFTRRRLGSLSGGERQRAVLARALAQEAPLLLLDEPTAALDLGHQQRALELVDELRQTNALTVLSAMHDLTLAAQYADRLLLLADGRPAAEGSPAEVLTEHLISAHYGARVLVLNEGSTVAVLPRRERREVEAVG